MIIENGKIKTIVVFVWGGFDALYLIWYIIGSLRNGKVPYLADGISTLALLSDHGLFQIGMVLLSWVLQLSITVSCFLFFARRDEAKWVSYLQIPLRLFFLVPSVSILLMGAQFFPDYNPILMVVLILVSEMVKGWSLWRFGVCQRPR